MNFKSLPQLLDYFKEEETGKEYYANIRWAGNPTCPHCNTDKAYVTTRGYKCRNSECYKKFTVKTGTIFENSKIPFRIWFAAIYLATSHKKGISSVQLSIDLGITQKTAWFVLHRIREMLKDKAPQMLGENNTVEADETYIGGKEGNKHYSKRRSEENPALLNNGEVFKDKKVVLGIIERSGRVVLKHVPRATKTNLQNFIKSNVSKDSTLYTDDHKGYTGLGNIYTHETVTHSLQVYAEGDIHTNTIESFWSVLKRGLYGVYHQVSEKHLERYLDEFSSRFNARDLKSEEKIKTFLHQSESYLSYKRLIAK
ncbi:IS1595 family transposase [Reichenbachiella ulvae]|uniref:IS1595 family transposase n=1 Tax=Reichenbachiella ulvae TaxID=2980104 RepID=A0ABT3CUX7_9BACT|nr:IS1595 family transposase [Reichenbachiella ulvae]MCV9387324.1 IS1595 family transposase [Reichenbachiella ulvae]